MVDEEWKEEFIRLFAYKESIYFSTVYFLTTTAWSKFSTLPRNCVTKFSGKRSIKTPFHLFRIDFFSSSNCNWGYSEIDINFFIFSCLFLVQ